MVFIDVYSGKESKEKAALAKKLGIKLAPGDYSLLISKGKSEVRGKRKKFDFVTAFPNSKQEMNSLLTDTHYDFLVIEGFTLGKRNIRMAKRYETSIAIPVSSAFSMKKQALRRLEKNLSMVVDGGADLLICSGAKDPKDLRGGFELASIGAFLGVPEDLAIKAVRQLPAAILLRNDVRKKEKVLK